MEEHSFHSSPNSDQFDPDDCISEPPSPIDGGIMQPPIDDEIMENNGVSQPPIDGGPIDYDEVTQPPVDDGLREPPDHRFNEIQISETPLQTETKGSRQSKLPQRKKRKETAGDSRGLPDQVQTSEPLLPAETTTGDGQSKLTADQKYTKRLKEKWDDLERVVPGCSEIKFKGDKLDKITSFTRSLKQQVQELTDQNNHWKEKYEQLSEDNTTLKEQIGMSKMEADEQYKHLQEKYEHISEYNTRLKEQIGMSQMEADEQNKHWKEKYEQLSGYNTTLKEQIETSKMEADEQYKHLKEKYEQLNGEHTRLKEKMGLLGKLPQHQSVSLRQPTGEAVRVNAKNSTPEEPQVSVETSGVNDTEPAGDASCHVPEPQHRNERVMESVLPSNEEEKVDEAEFTSGGTEDEPADRNGPSGDPSAVDRSSKKRKQRVEEEPVLVDAPSLTIEGLQESIQISGLKSVSGVESQQEIVLVNTASSMPEGPQDIAEIRGLNATGSTGNASLQVQKPIPNIVREIEAVLSSNEEAKHGSCGSSGNEQEPFDLNGICDDPSAMVLSLKRRKQSIEGAEVERTTTIRSPAERFPSMQLSVSHPTSNGDAAAADTDILTKLNADVVSTVEFSDFSYLEKERLKLGEYSVPPSLLQTAKNIIYLYNHVYAKCKMNPRTIEPINIVFIAAIKEMNDLIFGLVLNEERILKLGDAVSDALRINFNVGLAMEYLKKFARALIALKELEDEPLRRLKGKDVSSAAAETDILTKLDTSHVSTVELSDFPGLNGEHIKMGKYSVPSSLESTSKKISGVCGDFSATCKMNPQTVNPIYIMLCAAVKEMNDQPIKQVTEERILKWRDAIKDALRVGFEVDFAKEYLEKIGRAVIALKEVENHPLRRVQG